jgi:hypothetical protein
VSLYSLQKINIASSNYAIAVRITDTDTDTANDWYDYDYYCVYHNTANSMDKTDYYRCVIHFHSTVNGIIRVLVGPLPESSQTSVYENMPTKATNVIEYETDQEFTPATVLTDLSSYILRYLQPITIRQALLSCSNLIVDISF